ncbi:MAG TPA: hypothetical protein VF756_17675 [Thermoanaerobaculia bacterium]
MRKASVARAILWGGLTAGVLDLTAALVQSGLRGRSPVSLLQSISSGLLGADSFQGGAATAALGAVLHFVIAFVAAAVYVAASRKLKWLVRRPVVCGLLYGVAVYLVMTFVVVPLSAAPFKLGASPSALATGLAIHMLCVGLPIALVARRFLPAS